MMNGWTMMTGYGFGHWVIFALAVAIIIYPVGKILIRLGFSPFWSILALIPPFNLIALWVLALIDWPEAGAYKPAKPKVP